MWQCSFNSLVFFRIKVQLCCSFLCSERAKRLFVSIKAQTAGECCRSKLLRSESRCSTNHAWHLPSDFKLESLNVPFNSTATKKEKEVLSVWKRDRRDVWASGGVQCILMFNLPSPEHHSKMAFREKETDLGSDNRTPDLGLDVFHLASEIRARKMGLRFYAISFWFD